MIRFTLICIALFSFTHAIIAVEKTAEDGSWHWADAKIDGNDLLV